MKSLAFSPSLLLVASACRKGEEDDPITLEDLLEDVDGDGFDILVDCDDADPDIHPDAEEVCDDVDNDCDGRVDEDDATDTSTWYADFDADGYGSPHVAVQACELPRGYVDDATDCDDARADIHPGAEEDDCADPVDYNCDGSVAYADADADGWAACLDCDDSDPTVSPLAVELCDGVDNDCDGATDDSASLDAPTWYADADDDGFGDATAFERACAAPAGHVANSDDCDDTAAAVHPGADEVCNDVDDDCDGVVDLDVTAPPVWYADADGDGHGGSSLTLAACTAPEGYLATSDDCDDLDPRRYPTNAEVCDGVDNDCSGGVDADELDADGDGVMACAGDCDDADAARAPGLAEVCDGVDSDCDGTVPPDETTTVYRDADGDGHGDPAVTALRCEAPFGVLLGDDCDDTDARRYPTNAEVCDGVDSDCSGSVDADELDADGDGVMACAGDCDDADAARHPGLVEVCDGVDNDCDGVVPDGETTTVYLDADGDGHGNPSATSTRCEVPFGLLVGDDCDDSEPDRFPTNFEACDGLDNDCSGGLPADEADADGDGWMVCEDDCDDLDPTVRPNAVEVWYDGIDQDCDAGSDYDQDGDGDDAVAWGGTDRDDLDPGCSDTCGDGLTWDQASDSCLDILQDYPGSSDGHYYIDPTHDGDPRDAVLISCDMTGGGWSLVWENDFTSDHANTTFTVDCDCTGATYDHSSAGWLLGVSGCEGDNRLTHPGLGSHSFRIEFDVVDVGTATEIRHTGSLQPDRGYDYSWCADLVTSSPFANNGEFGSMIWTGERWEWFARYGTDCATFDVTTTAASIEAPYMVLGYDGGGPTSCDTKNADGGYAHDWEIWVR